MIRIALRLLIGLLLLATGLAKLADMAGFVAIVGRYQLLPVLLTPVAAWMLVAAELTLGAWLVSGRQARRAALITALLHLAYAGWTALALARGLTLANCGCFGTFWQRPLGWTTLAEDVLLLALALCLYRSLAAAEAKRAVRTSALAGPRVGEEERQHLGVIRHPSARLLGEI